MAQYHVLPADKSLIKLLSSDIKSLIIPHDKIMNRDWSI